MSVLHEFHLNALAPGLAQRLSRLRSLGQRLLRLPLMSALRPLTRRIIAAAEPAGRVWLRAPPSAPESEPSPITVVTANLWHDWPRQRRLVERMESFSRLVESEQADIVLLQEVSRTPDLHVDAWLAQQLGMACVYSRANGHEGEIGFEEGLAIFSRYPLVDLHLRQLGAHVNPFVRRLALGAEIATPHGNLLAFSVHLGLRRRHNAAQLFDLQEWVAGVTGSLPALVGGDFNAHEHSPQILSAQRTWLDTFRHLHPEKDGTTHELRWPWGGLLRRHRLDYIFLHSGGHDWDVLETRHLDSPDGPHSDHRAVLTRIALAPAGTDQ